MNLPKEVEDRIKILGEELCQIEQRRQEIRSELKQYCIKYGVKISVTYRQKFSLSEFVKMRQAQQHK